ncbi:MAG TPA: amino acid adenylation domain-containing protein [Candidatus Angelobacter sp.]|jgi:amino acid adenylation domain-containing protein/non-ribosomal peptide synthase protein (TIGR01720 family)
MSAPTVALQVLPGQEKLYPQLKEIFAKVLGIAPAEIGITTSFIELGLDSLALSDASLRLQQTFGVLIPFRALLEQLPTIEKVAGRILELAPQPAETAKPEEPSLPGHLPAKEVASQKVVLQTAVEQAKSAGAPTQPLPSHPLNIAGESDAVARIVQLQLKLMAEQLGLLQQYGQGSSAIEASVEASPATPALGTDGIQAGQNGTGENKTSPLSSSPAAPESDSKASSSAAQSAPSQPAIQPYVAFQPIQPGAPTLKEAAQQAYLESLIQRVSSQTLESKRRSQQHREFMGDNRWSAGFRLLWKEMFYPLMSDRAEGSHVWDVDGHEYVDLTMGFGSLFFGHTPSFVTSALHKQIDRGIGVGPQSALAGDVARLVCEMTGVERVTFCNSGTEGVMTALRLARMATKRNKIVVFAGSYHGTFDGVLVRPTESANGTMKAIPISGGIDPDMVKNVVMLAFNSPESIEYIRKFGHEIAAVLVEPIQSRRPDIEPREFLHGLRKATEETGSLLIFDEVIIGFRMHPGGAQAIFDVRADLVVYGKAIGAGLPIGVVAGKRVYIDAIDGGAWNYGDQSYPQADTTFAAGTFFKHPLVMAAAWAGLNYIKSRGMELYEELGQRTHRVVSALQALFDQHGLPLFIANRGSLFRILPAKPFPMLELFFYSLLTKGIYVWENRVCYLSTAHTDEDCDRVIQASKEAIEELIAAGVWQGKAPKPQIDVALLPAQADAGSHREVKTIATTEAQREFWASSNLSRNGPGSHNLSHVLRFNGELRVEAMQRALETVVSRHDSLRASFNPEGTELQVFSSVPVTMELVDLTNIPSQSREEQLERLIRQAGEQPFDLGHAPLFRAQMVRVATDDHYLLLTISHIIADGWSIAVILSELSEAYSAELKGSSFRLGKPRQFAEYVEWLANHQKQSSNGDEAFWLARFSDAVPPLGLFSTRNRPLTTTYAGDSYTIHSGPELRQALAQFSSKHGSTLFSTLLAGLSGMLTRMTGQKDTVIAVASAGQSPASMPHLVGYCLNLLFHRTKLRNNSTVAEHVTETSNLLMEEQEHRGYSANRLLRQLNSSPSEPRLPVEVAFNVDRDLAKDMVFDGLKMEFVKRPSDSVSFPFGLMVTDNGRDLELRFEYATDFFEETAVRQIASCYRRLLEEMAAHPEHALSHLDILTSEEQQRALVEWNQTDREFPRDSSITELFEQQAAQTPEQVAVAFRDARLTYAQLNRQANQLAHHLVELGAGPEQVVAIWLDRSPEMVATMLAVLKTGAAYFPVDHKCPPERLASMLIQAGVKILVTEDGNEKQLLPGWTGTRTTLGKQAKAIRQASRQNLKSKPRAGDLAYVIYTSGSTGEPKGIMIPHQGVVRLVKNTSYISLGSNDCVAQASNAAFDAATFEIWGALLNGARLAILEREDLLDPHNLERQIAVQGINTMFLTTALVNQIVALNPRAFAGLKQLLFGGEAVNCQRVREILPRPERLLHVYGPTENTTFSTWHEIRQVSDNDQTIPIGAPLSNSRAYVLDEEMSLSPVGVIGELYLGGAGLARGYLGRPDWTAMNFVPDPFSSESGQRLYRTGDLVRYRADGAVEFVGRRDHQVKLRGFRIELGEIESALRDQPEVKEAIITVHQASDKDQRLIAYVVVDEGRGVTAAELHKQLKQRVPEYMVPSGFVFLDALPLTPNGKIDRAALPEPHLEQIAVQAYVPPASRTEEQLCAIWSEVLALEQVGVNDNFFEAGGDSILAIRMIASARKIGIPFTLLQLYENPTIAELAQLSQLTPNIAEDRNVSEGTAELTPIQRWFFEQDLADVHHFNQSALFELGANLDPETLKLAAEALVKQHDALRMRYERGASGWQQRVQAGEEPVFFARFDFSSLSSNKQGKAVEAKAEELQRSLDLEHGPLLRVALFEFGPGKKSQLLIVIHHLAVDFVSWGILLEDLALAYQQLQRQESIHLPEKSDSFQSWGTKLLECADSAKLREELPYWSNAERQQKTPLPVDFPEGPNTMEFAEQITVGLSPEQTESLVRHAARTYNALPHELILSALLQAIGNWSGTMRTLVDVESNGRMLRLPGLDVSRTVGWFTAIYPVLLQASSIAEPKECLQQVQRQLRGVPGSGVGYGLLRYLCSDAEVRKQLTHLPEAQVCFNYFGRFDRIIGDASPFQPSIGAKGASESPHAQRKYLLEVEGMITSGCLQVHFRYGKAIHLQSTIAHLAQFFHQALCAYLPNAEPPAKHFRLAEDFPLADLSQQDLDHLVAELSEVEV